MVGRCPYCYGWCAGYLGFMEVADQRCGNVAVFTLVRRLRAESCTILAVDRSALDLTRQAETEQWIGTAKPDAVILAAAKVGGIAFNDSHPVDFLSDNLAIA